MKKGEIINVFSVNNPVYKDAFLNRGDEDEDTWVEYGHQSVKRVIDEVKKIKFPIKVYRGVSENYDKNYEGEAENRSWTTDKSVAEKFAGYFGQIVSKIINEKDVDYEATISRRIMHHALNESEINLNDNGITKKYEIEKMKNGGEVLLAPNGKPSNLTPEQYKLVRTPEFKAWFGDWENSPETASKVVDENGEPKVLFHGSPYKFNIFTTKEEPRFFFTDNLALANHFADYLEDDEGNIIDGKIYQVFLNLKNPKINKKADSNSNETINQAYEIYEDLVDKYEDGEIEENILLESSEGAILFYENWYSVGATNLTNYVVFNSNQIKLADGTNTTFDSNNPDIRYADGGELNMGNEIKERLFWIEYLNELIENEKKYAIQTLYFSKATGDEIYQYISFLSPDGNYKKPSVISKLNKTAIGTLSQVNDVYKNFSLDKLGFKIIKIENEKMEKGGGISEQKYFKVIKNTKPIFAVKIAEGEENISGMSELVMDRLTDYGYFLNEISKSDYENFDYSKIDADDITAFLGILEYFNTENYEAKFNAHKIPSREIFTLAMEVRNTYPKLWFKRGSEYGNQAFKDLIKVMKRGYWLDTEQELYKKRKEYIDAHKEDVDLDDVISMLKWMGEVRGGYDYMLNVIQKNA